MFLTVGSSYVNSPYSKNPYINKAYSKNVQNIPFGIKVQMEFKTEAVVDLLTQHLIPRTYFRTAQMTEDMMDIYRKVTGKTGSVPLDEPLRDCKDEVRNGIPEKLKDLINEKLSFFNSAKPSERSKYIANIVGRFGSETVNVEIRCNPEVEVIKN